MQNNFYIVQSFYLYLGDESNSKNLIPASPERQAKAFNVLTIDYLY